MTADLAPLRRPWVIDGPVTQGLDRANWTFAELADHLSRVKGIRVRKSAMQRFRARHRIRPYRPSYRFLRGDPAKQAAARAELAALKKKALASELVLLSQEEARFPMAPTLCRTLDVKGHRPVVGTWDNKHYLYVFASVNVASCALHTDAVAAATGLYRRAGEGKTRRLQRAFAAHLRRLGRRYPKERHRRVVLLIDNAPWHTGAVVQQALAGYPQLELKRLPSYSPQLNVIERFWRLLRQ